MYQPAYNNFFFQAELNTSCTSDPSVIVYLLSLMGIRLFFFCFKGKKEVLSFNGKKVVGVEESL